MKQDINGLKRETAKLKGRVGLKSRPVVFRALDGSGQLVGNYGIDGKEMKRVSGKSIVLAVPALCILALLAGDRTTVLYGGRSAGKSWTVAIFLVAMAYTFGLRILCLREIQNSISDSVHALLRDQIERVPEFLEFFEVLESEIRGLNGSTFIFRGLRKENAYSIKSFESIDICWAEEAQSLSLRSLILLEPTIRKAGSRLIYSFNPENSDDAIFEKYVAEAV